jgi:taurine dioxygenase
LAKSIPSVLTSTCVTLPSFSPDGLPSWPTLGPFGKVRAGSIPSLHEVTGIDLREPLSADLRNELHELLLKYKVLFFRDQAISREQHIHFGQQFGELDVHQIVQVAEAPTVQPISAKRFRQYSGPGAPEKRYTNRWHIDETFRAVPPLGSILRAVELPELGSDTVFADAAAAYEGLSNEVRERIANLRAVHSAVHGFGWYNKAERKAAIEREFPPG